MSLHHIANHLASKGRNGDTTLVHMTKGEVAGLQALAKAHGTTLTRNPHTGLPEAFSLKSLVPMAAGAALTPFVGPMGAAAIVGGLGYLQTGSLTQGLMAGLGAYGGAGLMGGVNAMGAEAGTQMAAGEAEAAAAKAVADEEAKQAVLQQASSGIGAPPPLSPTVSPEAALQSTRDFAANQAGNTYELVGGYRPTFGPQAMGPQMPGAIPDAVVPANTGFSTATQTALTSPAQTGFQAAFDKPGTYIDKLGGGMQAAKYGLAAAAPVIADEMTPKAYVPPEIKGDADMGQRYAFESGYDNSIPGRTGPASYRQISNEEAKKLYGFAEGGEVQYPVGEPVMRMAKGGYTAQDAAVARGGLGLGIDYSGYDTMPNQGIAAMVNRGNPNQKIVDLYKADEERRAAEEAAARAAAKADESVDMPGVVYGAQYASGGGISTLGGYSDGGRLLKGPGDGMSDNIPARIGAKQPARLADGEFVVPADVVSHLGNGSTDAGAKQLYKMMDKVRTARTGRKAQGKQINPNKYVPA